MGWDEKRRNDDADLRKLFFQGSASFDLWDTRGQSWGVKVADGTGSNSRLPLAVLISPSFRVEH